MSGALQKSSEQIDGQLLEQAFDRFNECSLRLEQRYQGLLKETEILRQKLLAKDAELKRAEKLSVLGETAAAIAHEVRNPLGALKLFASLLLQDIEPNTEHYKIVQQMDNTIRSLDHVVTNILHFAKGAPQNLGPINLHNLILGQLEHFRAAYGQNATIVGQLEGPALIIGNEASLRQAIHNLLLNALQATQYKGEIYVSTKTVGNYLQLEVADNGPGIDEKLIDAIFEPFVTTKNEGTGLGLALVKRVMTEHQASIAVFNQAGAHFIFKFPIKV